MFTKIFCKHFLSMLILIPVYIGAECLPGLDSPVPYKTPSPINIITFNATLAKIGDPITIFTPLFATLTVINEGDIIEVYWDENIDHSYVTGGVLCDKKYKFYKGRIYITQNPIGRSATEVNGLGAPIEAVSMYYNEKYNSFAEAIGKPGGIVQLSSLVSIGPAPNIFFYPFESELLSGALEKPGSSTKIFATLFFPWFFTAFPTVPYYAYSGTYSDLKTGKELPGTIDIVPAARRFISLAQFAAFKKVLGPNGKPIDAIATLYPRGERPLYKSFGFKPGFTFM